MMQRVFCLALFAVSTFPVPGAPPAEDAEALRVARRCEAALRGKTQHGHAVMTVQRPEWKRTLEMDFWYVAPSKTFIAITAPAKEAGTRTLRLATNMWMYLPSVERVIKIAPSLMLQPWMGSDFTNDDLVKESSLVDDYVHQLDGEAVVDGDTCYRLIATAKPDAPVVWGKIIALIR
jgi:outer membrane lipoprotein-sorting protein